MSCGYKIGKLKNFVYLIENLVYKVVEYKVYITGGRVYKLDADSVIFNETESYNGRFKFSTSVTCTLQRYIDDEILRQSQFKIVVEDLSGMLFLVSPEFDAVYTSELNITKSNISYQIFFNTLSNIPTRILQSKITPIAETNKPCEYSDTGITKLSIGRDNDYEEVDYLTASYKKVFNGRLDNTQVVFTIPIEDNDWHYNLIKFPNNRWDVKLYTNREIIEAYSLFPQYTRQTQEEGLDKFTFTLSGFSTGTLPGKSSLQGQFRWSPTNEYVCEEFNKYQKEEKLQLINNKWVSLHQYRKGILLERNSTDCGYSPSVLYRWVNLPSTEYVCVGFNKHYKLKLQKSVNDGVDWVDTGEFRAGDLMEVNSKACDYALVEWIPVENQYICDDYELPVTWVLLSDEFYCTLKTI